MTDPNTITPANLERTTDLLVEVVEKVRDIAEAANDLLEVLAKTAAALGDSVTVDEAQTELPL